MTKIIKDLLIEKLAYKGYGLGFNDSNPVFVTNAVPGDNLDVEITNQKKNVIFGIISKINSKSKNRIEPGCEAFGECGGCDWLNVNYDFQLQQKQQIVREIYRNIPVEKIESIFASPMQEEYRNKSFFPIGSKDGKPVIGMFARKSHELVSHKNCSLFPAFIDEVIKLTKNYLLAAKVAIYDEKTGKGTARHLGIRYSQATGEIIVILVTKTRKIPFTNQFVRVLKETFPNIVGAVQNINAKQTNVILGDEEKILYGRDHIFEEMGDLKFKLHYKSFFQINNDVAHEIYKTVKVFLSADETIIDAYSGIGSIGMFVSDKAKEVICIENNKAATEDAKINAKLNEINNCSFICADVEKALPEQYKEKQIDTIIFDPPRKGLQPEVIAAIPENLGKIIYISCDPTTQARDVALLLKTGFKVKYMKSFDMFPQTWHIENLIILEK
jgi:23S rRNA (uracil1939-C5)-methyltransferase